MIKSFRRLCGCPVNKHFTKASSFIDNNIDINAQNDFQETALMLAIQNNSKEIVEKILQKQDVKLDLKDTNGCTALMHAIEQDNIEILKLVLNKIKSLPNPTDYLNTTNNLSQTPLLKAIDKNAPLYVKLLLQHPVNVNQTNNELITPLMLASQKQNKDIVISLLSHKDINLTIQDIYGNNVLGYAIDNAEILNIILQRMKYLPNYISYVNILNQEKKQTILFNAVQRHTRQTDYLPQINLLLEAGVNIETRDSNENNICMFASDPKILETLKNFMQNRPDQFNESSIINLFFKKNKRDSNVLHKAAKEGNNDIIDFLLKINPQAINIQDVHGYTPLLLAIKQQITETVELLLSFHKDIDLKAHEIDDKSLVRQAIENAEILNLILQSIASLPNYTSSLNSTNAKEQTILFDVVKAHTTEKDFIPQLVLLLKAGIEITAKDTDGNNICMFTSNRKVLETLKNFMHNHPNRYDESSIVDFFFNKNKEGLSLLHKAAAEGNDNIIDFLLEIKPGAINDQDSNGYTPLMLASNQQKTEVVSLLLSYQEIDVTIQDKNGNNALKHAINNAEILNLILQRVQYLPNFIHYLNTTNEKKETILFDAVQHHTEQTDYLPQINLFLKAGVDITTQDIYGNNICMFTSHLKVLETLKNFMHNHPNRYDESSIVDFFFNKNRDGLNTIHKAAREGNNDIIDFLLKINPKEINSQDALGHTPLMIASLKDKINTVRLLLQHKASTSITNYDGEDVIQIIRASRNMRNKDVILECFRQHFNTL